MPQPRYAAAEFGEELRGLGRDDGARLEQLLWLLSNQRRKLPRDPETLSAYNYALVLAGHTEEARAVALRVLADYYPETTLTAAQLQDALHHAAAVRSLLGITTPAA